jgi:hypothetical protein
MSPRGVGRVSMIIVGNATRDSTRWCSSYDGRDSEAITTVWLVALCVQGDCDDRSEC